MKKIIIGLLIIIMIMYLIKPQGNLTKDAIRFRVIANSNSSTDIMMKMKVVNELSQILFKKEKNIESTREDIINNIENIQNRIDDLFKDNDYNKKYIISYGLNHFPEKKYKNQIFKEGDYESLVIEIGEGKGNNYWCILYPPLCMIDDNFDNSEVKYDLKIVKILKELF